MKKINVAVLGCTGVVGQQFVKMLDGHPYFKITSLSSSRKSAGKNYGEAVDWIVGGDVPECAKNLFITETSPESLKKRDVKVVFSALPSAIARDVERKLIEERLYIFSNAGAHRTDDDVPIVIPEVNPDHLKLVESKISHGKGFIVTNSNCSTTGLVLGLKPLWRFGLKAVFVTTYQALSGAGRYGVSSLEILGNVLPFIKEEEEKVERETKKIFGILDDNRIVNANFEVNASCCRVPVQNGHLESVVIELDEDVDIGGLSEALSSFRGIPQHLKFPTAPESPVIVRSEVNRPQPVLDREAGIPWRAKGMAISVGRIRKKGKRINFFLLVHNTIRGAAGTCLLNAELAIVENYVR